MDEAGNRLAEAITEHREEWLTRLAEGEVVAAATFNLAIAEAQAALADLRPARGAVGWLNRFDTGLAMGGQYAPFSGGRLRVRARIGTARGDFDPTALLDAAAKVTEEAPAPPVVAHA